MRHPIVPMLSEFWPAVQQIYREGIATGNATFATEVPAWQEWDAAHLKKCRLVALQPFEEPEEEQLTMIPLNNACVLGWAALRPVSARRVYAGVAEVSVYVATSARGQGVGSALLEALVQESEVSGIWTLQAGIFPENKASIAMHKSHGFRRVGVRRRIGKMGNVWRDVLLLERRSAKVGV
jgi:L-amino acid N-acyltransferase YncA